VHEEVAVGKEVKVVSAGAVLPGPFGAAFRIDNRRHTLILTNKTVTRFGGASGQGCERHASK
jgi:hypothetical protein